MLSLIDDMMIINNHYYDKYINNMMNSFNMMSKKIDEMFEEDLKRIYLCDNSKNKDNKEDVNPKTNVKEDYKKEMKEDDKEDMKEDVKNDMKEDNNDKYSNCYSYVSQHYSHIGNDSKGEPIRHYYHKKDINRNGQHQIIETKRIGNKSITQKVHKDKEGKMKSQEYYNNISQDNKEDIDNFNKEWDEYFNNRFNIFDNFLSYDKKDDKKDDNKNDNNRIEW